MNINVIQSESQGFDMDIIEKIKNAKTINEMNNLRMEVVKARSKEILELWQGKYWEMKKCPTCGKIR